MPAKLDIPKMNFDKLIPRIRHFWNPRLHNPHKGLIAPTRSGKSYLIRNGLLSVVPNARIVLIDVKSGDDETWDEWGIQKTELKPGYGPGNHHIMLLPGKEGKSQIAKILDTVYAEGETILVMDDSKAITAKDSASLGLSDTVDNILSLGAAKRISVILGANSRTWATSGLRDQCGSYLIGHINNGQSRRDISQMIGLPKEYAETLGELNALNREFLYTDQYDETRVAITHI